MLESLSAVGGRWRAFISVMETLGILSTGTKPPDILRARGIFRHKE